MSESSIYQSSQSKVVAYRVNAYMSHEWIIGYQFVVKITEYLYPSSTPKVVYETSFPLKEDLNVKAFKKTLVALSELLFPESKEKEREFKRALFNSVTPGVKRPDDILIAESGPFPFPADKSLPTGEEIASKLTPIYEDLSQPQPIEKKEEVKPTKKEKDKTKTTPKVTIKGIKDPFLSRELDCLLFKLQIVLRTHEGEKEAVDLISFLITRLDKIRGAAAVTLTYKEFKMFTALVLLHDQTVELGEYNLNYLTEAKKLLENITNRDMSILHIWEYRLNLFADTLWRPELLPGMVLKSLHLIDKILECPSLREKVEEDEDFCQEIEEVFCALYKVGGSSLSSVHLSQKMLEVLERKLDKIGEDHKEFIENGGQRTK